MAPPETTTRQRSEGRSGRPPRTISSTTLLLILSLVLAVLAVLLSLPSRAPGIAYDPATGNAISFLTPKRTRELIARESSVAAREAEVARREAAVFHNAVGGVSLPTITLTSVATLTATATVTVFPEETLSAPGLSAGISSPSDTRVDDVVKREQRVSEREKDVAQREELVGRRESDASKRESWIMEHLVNDEADSKGKAEDELLDGKIAGQQEKDLAALSPSPLTVVSTVTHLSVITSTSAIRVTVTVPEPAATRAADKPLPEFSRTNSAAHADRTPSGAPSHAVVEDYIGSQKALPSAGESSAESLVENNASASPSAKGWFGGF